ncbi:MAG: asparaginase [Muribaculaceae bacterium]|nr:asparaginase [Muribaculaceae bacterium]
MNQQQQPKILIIYTGGTIGMIENPENHTLEPFDFDHLIDNVPKIKMLEYEIENFQFDQPIDSSSMCPSHWAEIAAVIEKHYDRVDGFVVLHGTDTMAYTASALSFMLRNLSKPVIITGSQLPIGEVRTDGEENLITALQIAAATDAAGKPMVREVAILFEHYLWRGNRCTKRSADNFNAFKSNNYPELARIGLGIHFNRESLWRPDMRRKPLIVQSDMDTNMLILDLFPGIGPNVVKHALTTPGLKGVVMKSFGAGNAPGDAWFLDLVRQTVERGVVVVNITQCPNGCVHPKLYAAGLSLANAGVISGRDMTSEAALTKLMYLFGMGLGADMVKKYMLCSIRGEMTIQ